MCEECDGKVIAREGVSRRIFLGAGAMLAGMGAAGLWSCMGEGNKRSGPGTMHVTTAESTVATGPATTGKGLGTEASTEVAASSEAATGPAPELGAEVFPDASGKAIARVSDAPVIVIPRSDWTSSGPNLMQIRVMGGVQKITVHHTAGELETDGWTRTALELERIREFHSGVKVTDRGWADIAYHFVVDRAGRVWQARPLAYQGAHVKGHNEHNLGIVLLGNFEVQSPTAAQLVTLENFIGFARTLYAVPAREVYTHGELGMTSCPGKRLQGFMDRMRKRWKAVAGVER